MRHSAVHRASLVLAHLALALTAWTWWNVLAPDVRGQGLTITHTPSFGADGVAPESPIVIRFSAAVATNTVALRIQEVATEFRSFSLSWSADGLTLTCTPNPRFAAHTMILWTLTGSDQAGIAFPAKFGFFTTGAASMGSGTNAVTTVSFGVSTVAWQSSMLRPRPVGGISFPFTYHASAVLASNRTATGVRLKLRDGNELALERDAVRAERFETGGVASSDWVNAPAGIYGFTVAGGGSNQWVEVPFPGDLATPNTPYLRDFLTTQSVDPTRSFTLRWTPFAGATASDGVVVAVRTARGPVFSTPDPGEPGALSATATSFEIPAGTLSPDSEYIAMVGFMRAQLSAGDGVDRRVYRSAATEFTLATVNPLAASPRVIIDRPLYDVQSQIRVSAYAPVVFTFTQAMNPGRTAGTFTNLTTGTAVSTLPAQWSDDRKSLTYAPAGSWPLDTVIAWGVAAEDAAGRLLVGTRAGSFRTGFDNPNPASMVQFVEARYYQQDRAGLPVPNLVKPWTFRAQCLLGGSRYAERATLVAPDQLAFVMDQDENEFETSYFNYAVAGPDYGNRTGEFPRGRYQVALETYRTNEIVGVDFPAGLAVGDVPRLTDLGSMRAIDPSGPLTLRWEPFSSAAPGDCVYVELRTGGAGLFATAPPGDPAALPGNTTTLEIPAGTFAPWGTYTGRVSFCRVVTQVPSTVIQRVVVANVTEFVLRAAGSPLTPPPPLPVVTRGPLSTRVGLGGRVEMSVLVASDLPVAYQWLKNGQPLVGANLATLVIDPVEVASGGAYAVVVSSAAGAVTSAPAVLDLALDPLILADHFSDRGLVVGAAGRGTGNNGLATTNELFEPLHAGKRGGRSVWLTWRAPVAGRATFSTAGSSFDTLLAVYTGNQLDRLERIASDEDSAGFLTSRVVFDADAGGEYQVAIDGFAGASGALVLEWRLDPGLPQLPRIVTAPKARTVVTNGSTVLEVEAVGLGLTFQWRTNGVAIVGATNASLRLTGVGPAHAGVYSVAVTNAANQGLETTGALVEVVSSAGAAAAQDKLEDLFAEPRPGVPVLQIAGGSAWTTIFPGVTETRYTNGDGAGKSPGDPVILGQVGSASLWLRFRVAEQGFLRLSTEGSSIPTLLGIFADRGGLRVLALAPDLEKETTDSAVVEVPAQPGVDYLAMVDGQRGARGLIKLSASLPILDARPESPRVEIRDGRFVLRHGVSPGWYQLAAGDEVAGWAPLMNTNVTVGILLFTEPYRPTAAARFYQLLRMP